MSRPCSPRSPRFSAILESLLSSHHSPPRWDRCPGQSPCVGQGGDSQRLGRGGQMSPVMGVEVLLNAPAFTCGSGLATVSSIIFPKDGFPPTVCCPRSLSRQQTGFFSDNQTHCVPKASGPRMEQPPRKRPHSKCSAVTCGCSSWTEQCRARTFHHGEFYWMGLYCK